MPEPLVPWPQPLLEFFGFLGVFLWVGSIGFRAAVVGGDPRGETDQAGTDVRRWVEPRAAWLGVAGAVLATILYSVDLPGQAAERHTTLAALVRTPVVVTSGIAFLAGIVGLLAGVARMRWGWWLAGAGVLLQAIAPGLFGRWRPVASPAHELAAGLWIGTLSLLVMVGLTATSRVPMPPERRGALAREMVNRFSPLALAAAGLLALLGVTTAWIHLKKLSALWSTPYGVTLIVKLCLVAVVIGLGAWNNLRQKRRMGTESGTLALAGSAKRELAVALVVLAVTAILVSLPTPGEQ